MFRQSSTVKSFIKNFPKMLKFKDRGSQKERFLYAGLYCIIHTREMETKFVNCYYLYLASMILANSSACNCRSRSSLKKNEHLGNYSNRANSKVKTVMIYLFIKHRKKTSESSIFVSFFTLVFCMSTGFIFE